MAGAIAFPLKPYTDKLKSEFALSADEKLFEHITPSSRLSLCAVCKSDSGKYSLCAKCGWERYCSKKCQESDWPTHKKTCKKNHRIDLVSFQGFIACLADTCMETETEADFNAFAMHDILNKPDSSMKPTTFSDGFTAKIVQLGDIPDIAREPWKAPAHDLARWWPQGPSRNEREYLLRRFQNDICPLKLHLSLAITILAELYMRPQGSKEPLVTLRVATSPVTDFGLVFGSCPGRPENCYAFQYRDGRIERGANPAEHVWMYFKTADEQEFYLDMSLNLFGLGTYVDARQFWKDQGESATFISDYVGMFWFDKRLYPKDFHFYEERNRQSVMRSEIMAQIARYIKGVWTGSDGTLPKRIIVMTLTSFAQLLTGRELLIGDGVLVLKWAIRNMRRMQRVLDSEQWRHWPEAPVMLASDGGVGPGIPMAAMDKDEYVERAKKYAKRSRRATSRERKHQ